MNEDNNMNIYNSNPPMEYENPAMYGDYMQSSRSTEYNGNNEYSMNNYEHHHIHHHYHYFDQSNGYSNNYNMYR